MDEAEQVAEISNDLFDISLIQKNISETIPDSSITFPANSHFSRPLHIAPINTTTVNQVNSPRYITKIYSSPRRIMPNRVRPYYIPERSRTKSENADTSTSLYQETRNIVDSVNNLIMMDTCDPIIDISATTGVLNIDNKNNVIILKKSKSLEDIRTENLDGSTPSHEMEFVSSRIQKLKVQE